MLEFSKYTTYQPENKCIISNAAFIDLFQGPSGFPGDPGPPGEPGPAVRNLFSSHLVVVVVVMDHV